MTNSEKALQMHEQWNGKIEERLKKLLPEAFAPRVAEAVCKAVKELI